MVIMVQGEPSSRVAPQDESGNGDGARARLARLAGSFTSSDRNVHDVERLLSAAGGLALLGMALRRRDTGSVVAGVLGAFLLHRGATGHCRLYGALGMNTADNELVQQHGPRAVLDAQKAVKVVRTVTIDMPRAELYRYWRDFENLPAIMSHLESVEVLDERRSRWRVNAPGGQLVEWEAEIINEVPDGLIAWRSAKNATVPNAGSVHFTDAPGGGTEVRVILEYQPPAGLMGVAVAKLWGEEPDVQVREDLQRFKRAMKGGRAG